MIPQIDLLELVLGTYTGRSCVLCDKHYDTVEIIRQCNPVCFGWEDDVINLACKACYDKREKK